LGGRRDGRPRTAMGWEVVPEGLTRVLSRLWRLYRKPMLVTENGMAAVPGVSRRDFLQGHLAALSPPRAGGCGLQGRFPWSLVDNWEWGSYRPRFGLYTRDRRPAEGADYYASVVRSGELPHG